MTYAMEQSRGEQRVTPTDYKTLEGQRIQALMGAIAALPGAALVASGPEGAPLFGAALITVAAAFMFWIFTDGIYHFSTIPNRTADEWARLLRAGYRYQRATILYGAASVFLSMAGFAGVHGGLSTGLSVTAGFLIDVVLFAVVLLHILWSVHERNQIGAQARAASIANAAHGRA